MTTIVARHAKRSSTAWSWTCWHRGWRGRVRAPAWPRTGQWTRPINAIPARPSKRIRGLWQSPSSQQSSQLGRDKLCECGHPPGPRAQLIPLFPTLAVLYHACTMPQDLTCGCPRLRCLFERAAALCQPSFWSRDLVRHPDSQVLRKWEAHHAQHTQLLASIRPHRQGKHCQMIESAGMRQGANRFCQAAPVNQILQRPDWNYKLPPGPQEATNRSRQSAIWLRHPSRGCHVPL